MRVAERVEVLGYVFLVSPSVLLHGFLADRVNVVGFGLLRTPWHRRDAERAAWKGIRGVMGSAARIAALRVNDSRPHGVSSVSRVFGLFRS